MSKSDSKLKKHLPKRCMNEKLKARRTASWSRSQAKKEARREAQNEREARNRELRTQGLPTPWEATKIR